MPKFISVVKFVVKEGEVENFTASMKKFVNPDGVIFRNCLLYTSDAADEE